MSSMIRDLQMIRGAKLHSTDDRVARLSFWDCVEFAESVLDPLPLPHPPRAKRASKCMLRA